MAQPCRQNTVTATTSEFLPVPMVVPLGSQTALQCMLRLVSACFWLFVWHRTNPKGPRGLGKEAGWPGCPGYGPASTSCPFAGPNGRRTLTAQESAQMC